MTMDQNDPMFPYSGLAAHPGTTSVLAGPVKLPSPSTPTSLLPKRTLNSRRKGAQSEAQGFDDGGDIEVDPAGDVPVPLGTMFGGAAINALADQEHLQTLSERNPEDGSRWYDGSIGPGVLASLPTHGFGAFPTNGPTQPVVTQILAADKAANNFGLPEISGMLHGASLDPRTVGMARWDGSVVVPPQGGRVDPGTMLHEAIHTLESGLTPGETQRLTDLIAANPPPNGEPTAHHPYDALLRSLEPEAYAGSKPSPVTGLTDYFGYINPGHPAHPELANAVYSDAASYSKPMSVTGDPILGPAYTPVPQPILDFMREMMPIVAARNANPLTLLDSTQKNYGAGPSSYAEWLARNEAMKDTWQRTSERYGPGYAEGGEVDYEPSPDVGSDEERQRREQADALANAGDFAASRQTYGPVPVPQAPSAPSYADLVQQAAAVMTPEQLHAAAGEAAQSGFYETVLPVIRDIIAQYQGMNEARNETAPTSVSNVGREDTALRSEGTLRGQLMQGDPNRSAYGTIAERALPAALNTYNALNVDVPLVTPAIENYVKPAVGLGLDVMVPALGASKLAGGPDIGRTIADVAVPSKSADLALTALPFAGKASEAIAGLRGAIERSAVEGLESRALAPAAVGREVMPQAVRSEAAQRGAATRAANTERSVADELAQAKIAAEDDAGVARTLGRQGEGFTMSPPTATPEQTLANMPRPPEAGPTGGGAPPVPPTGEVARPVAPDVTPPPPVGPTPPQAEVDQRLAAMLNDVPEPTGLPVKDLDKYQSSQLWAHGETNPPLQGMQLDEVRTRLYNAGFESTGPRADVRALYEEASGRGIKLPYEEAPSGLPDAYDLARMGRTPQSPLNAPPGEEAHPFRDALFGGTSPKSELPAGTPGADVALAQRNAVSGTLEDIKGSALTPDESKWVERRLESPSAVQQGRAPTSAEASKAAQAASVDDALNEAQMNFADRVIAQQERFAAGNNREMTRTELVRMMETERVAAGIKPEEVTAGVLDWLNLPRSLMAGADMSYALRQGVVLAGAHMPEFVKAIGTGIHAGFSEEYAMQVARKIESSPNAPLRGNLYIAPMGRGEGTLLSREDQYASPLLDRIPLLGDLYRPFERGNTVLINQLRSDVADNFIGNMLKMRGETVSNASKEAQRNADIYMNFINRATGRGTLGNIEKAAVPLSQVFFSLRNAIAKPQAAGYLNPANALSESSRYAYTQTVKDFIGFAALGGSTLALASAAGLKVGLDPRSADFGKIVAGSQHIDVWGGWQQQARAVYQAVQGARGEVNQVSQSGRESTRSPLAVALGFVGNRLSPQGAAAGQAGMAAFEDKLPPGIRDALREVLPSNRTPGLNAGTLLSYLTPLWVQDVADGIKYDGIRGGLVAAPLAFLGVGVQSYAGPGAGSQRHNELDSLAQAHGIPGVDQWSQLTAKEQREVMANATPEQRTKIEGYEKELRDNKDVFQLSRDERKAQADVAEKHKAETAPAFDRLYEEWLKGEKDPHAIAALVYQTNSKVNNEANLTRNMGPKLSESPAYQDAVKRIGSEPQENLVYKYADGYFGLYDKYRTADGKPDYDRIDRAQTLYLERVKAADPVLGARVEKQVTHDPKSDPPVVQLLRQIDHTVYDVKGYDKVPEGSKTQYRRDNPDVDALLALRNGGPVHSPKAGELLSHWAPPREVVYAR